jgi:alanyl-tRNA synthetase
VNERGFQEAKQAHALASGAGAFGKYDTTDNFYGSLLSDLVQQGRLGSSGVDYDPYSGARLASSIVAIIVEDKSLMEADSGDKVEIVTVSTPFYVEAGGEVGDTGFIQTESGAVIRVDDTKQPAQGLIVHGGEVIQGPVKVGMQVELRVNDDRRWDIRRNHTATHILHSELRSALGNQVTQQGSLVAPDRLRFDFSHGQAVGQEALMIIEAAINEAILVNDPVVTEHMGQKDAVKAGAMALFGEKYGDVVRTVKIGDKRSPYSFELCGGLHVNMTGDIGPFRFTSEEAVGAGLRRVEAVTGRQAQELIRERLATLDRLVGLLNTPVDEIEGRIDSLLTDNRFLRKQIGQLRRGKARDEFANLLKDMTEVAGVRLLTAVVDVPDMDGLREMADWFRDKIESGVALLAAVKDGRPIMVAVVTEDLIARGIRAGDIVRNAARIVGGGGGGRPAMAQAGGKDAGKLPEALDSVSEHISMLLGQ